MNRTNRCELERTARAAEPQPNYSERNDPQTNRVDPQQAEVTEGVLNFNPKAVSRTSLMYWVRFFTASLLYMLPVWVLRFLG